MGTFNQEEKLPVSRRERPGGGGGEGGKHRRNPRPVRDEPAGAGQAKDRADMQVSYADCSELGDSVPMESLFSSNKQ